MKTSRLVIAALLSIAAGTYASQVPVGRVSNIDSNGTVYGWAKDPDAPNTPIRVDIWADNTIFCGSCTAKHYHDRVAQYHGFRFTLPEVARYGPHNIYVYGIDATGDPNAAIQQGNPWPTTINVSSNDNCLQHASGAPYQTGPASANLVGGRPLNKNYTYKRLASALWTGTGVPWYQAGETAIRVTCAPRLAGAISSIIWDNVEMIDSGGHGSGLQYILHDNYNGQGATELYNPTEAGSAADDSFSWYSQSLVNLTPLFASVNRPDPITGSHIYQHRSSSSVQILQISGSSLHTKSRMAYWVPRSQYPVYGSYPKQVWTIYTKNLCRFNPPNPPGYNANSAFYSDYFAGLATRALHYNALPDTLPANLYHNIEPISDCVIDKTITWGVVGHRNLNNVLRMRGIVTIGPNAPPTNDVQLPLYPDHIRFRRTGAHTYTYNPATHVQTDVTNQPNIVVGPGAGAIIASGIGNRYAIASYSRQANVSQTCSQGTYITLQSSLHPVPPGATFTLDSYVIIGTLSDVEASISSLYSINPPP
jgi:hypothetical protein